LHFERKVPNLTEPASFVLGRKSKEIKKRNGTDRMEVLKNTGRDNINHRSERQVFNGQMPKEKVK
jgi:hypothetical protein